MAGPSRAMQNAAAATANGQGEARQTEPAVQSHQQREVPLPRETEEADERRTALRVYLFILVAFFSVQFGHGANIGVAISRTDTHRAENSKAENFALGSWVMVGVCVGLPITPWACRTFGAFQVCAVCCVLDFIAIVLMLWPHIGLHQIYIVRFLVGFFEAPLLPYLQEWLARHGKSTWNVWNTVLHAMVPVGENVGYLLAQELVDADFSWQWAFAGQAFLFASTVAACYVYGGRQYLDLSPDRTEDPYAENRDDEWVDDSPEDSVNDVPTPDPHQNTEVEYPATEKWCVYWATNASLAAQLGFLCGMKYVIRDYLTKGRQFELSVHVVTWAFSAIALIGPALGGSIAMSGSVIRPDRWTQHRKTLAFLACTTMVAAVLAVALPLSPEFAFWPNLFACFVAAGGVYPAAQGIINISLTSSRVIEASVYQVQCNNILFAMPLPFLIGEAMDRLDIQTSFLFVIFLQVMAAAGFCFGLSFAVCTEGTGIGDELEEEEENANDEEERNCHARLLPHGSRHHVPPQDSKQVEMQELLHT